MSRQAKSDTQLTIKTIWLHGEINAYGKSSMTKRKLTQYVGPKGTVHIADSVFPSDRDEFVAIWKEFKRMPNFSHSEKEVSIKLGDAVSLLKSKMLPLRPIKDERQKVMAKAYNEEIKNLVSSLKKIA